MKVKIKPLSVNESYRGRRFKTKEYQSYCQELFILLPKIEMPKGKLALRITFGFSNKASDVDNPVKPFVDVLQAVYDFNDKDIYRIHAEKKIVAKGEEYVEWELSPLYD